MLIIKKKCVKIDRSSVVNVTHENVFALEYGCVKQVYPQTKRNQDKSKGTFYTIHFSLCKDLDGKRGILTFHLLHFPVAWQINIQYFFKNSGANTIEKTSLPFKVIHTSTVTV